MKKRYKYKSIIMGAVSVILIAFFLAAYMFVWIRYYRVPADFGTSVNENILIAIVYLILVIMFSKLYNGMRIGYLRVSEIIYSQTLSMLLINAVTYIQICLISRGVMRVFPIAVLTAADVIFTVIWAYYSNKLYSALYPPRRLIMVSDGGDSAALASKMENKRSDRFNIPKTVGSEKLISEFDKIIQNYDAVLISNIDENKKAQILSLCFKHKKRVYMPPDISDIIIRGADSVHLFDTPLLVCKNGGLSVEQRFIKRAFDLVLSTLGFVVLSPIMLITAIAIKLCDGGKVFYSQPRLTRDGKVFTIYKFRSMKADAESDGVARLAEENDDRITPVGKIIRMCRIDELPQLINIIKGDMSIVGPRPERPELAARNEEEMPEFCFRLRVKAGLTGYAQVFSKYNTTPKDKLKLDLMYIEQYSFLLDLRLIITTIKILFIPESTEGVTDSKKEQKK